MSFRGGDFSTGEMRNFQPALTTRYSVPIPPQKGQPSMGSLKGIEERYFASLARHFLKWLASQ
jgi:hypothetical protein